MSLSEEVLKSIEKSFIELSGPSEVESLVEKAISLGVDPLRIIEAMRRGLEVVGEKYESGEYFLSDLIMAGLMATTLSNRLKPLIEARRAGEIGKVVIGTVKGDLHDIGKNIVSAMLASSGFKVIDLGVDVPAEKFIAAVKENNPKILAMSCLLTIALDEMKRVVDELTRAGLRSKVKVLVGGRPVTKEFAEEIGADGYAEDAVRAVKVALQLIKG